MFDYLFIKNPDKKPAVNQALRLARNIDFSEKWTDQEKSAMWENIRQQLIPVETKPHLAFRITKRKIWLAAASLAFILASAGILFTKFRTVEMQTAFGQIRKVTLPDGSMVTLNANSKLRYAKDFLGGKQREIWIDGEAFFNVSKRIVKGKKQPFTVHANDLNIQVLGTAFNVNNRRGTVNVALEHGQVKVVDENNNANHVLLKPGEGVTHSDQQKQLLKEKVVVADYASWQNRVIVFRKKSLNEIAAMMKDLYNMKVVIDNPALGTETFTGSFPTDSSEVLFRKLEKMYPLEVTRAGNEYHLK
jgi:ferric-dicitrate binding protein FerR (iron transport regulator)